jgi:hypothetical protein
LDQHHLKTDRLNHHIPKAIVPPFQLYLLWITDSQLRLYTPTDLSRTLISNDHHYLDIPMGHQDLSKLRDLVFHPLHDQHTQDPDLNRLDMNRASVLRPPELRDQAQDP